MKDVAHTTRSNIVVEEEVDNMVEDNGSSMENSKGTAMAITASTVAAAILERGAVGLQNVRVVRMALFFRAGGCFGLHVFDVGDLRLWSCCR